MYLLVEVVFPVTNNQNPVLVPEIPENTTVTDTIDIIAEFDFTADPNTIRNVIVSDELTAGELTHSIPPAAVSDAQFILNLGDIPPLVTVTATVSVTVPATNDAFVTLDVMRGDGVWFITRPSSDRTSVAYRPCTRLIRPIFVIDSRCGHGR